MCLQEEPSVRPLIGDVLAALSFLQVAPQGEPVPESLPDPTPPSDHKNGDSSESDSEDGSDSAYSDHSGED